jgi:lipopolysaccharide/colanic/teichoic acid biosynthesis glycosyltransferase
MIWIEDGIRAGVFYRQCRIGHGGRPFELLKFRSMCVDAESESGPLWSAKDDGRITFVGKLTRRFRIDELPQLLNVIKGEMSIVGPRPERPEFVELLNAEVPMFNLRHSVRPGLTGWAQLNFPYGASIPDAREKLTYDLYYIKNASLILDMLIFLQTIEVVIWGKAISMAGSSHKSEASTQINYVAGNISDISDRDVESREKSVANSP